MALKSKINKEEFAKLSDAFKAEYIVDGEGYKLDTDIEDPGELRRANDRNKAELAQAKKDAAEAQQKLAAIDAETARKTGDIATLEASWKAKSDAEKAALEGQIQKQKDHIQKQLVDSVALKLAGELSDSPALLIPHIKARLSADFEGETPSTRVMDATGKISALTVDDLKKEFSTNKDFSAIIRVSKASGAGGSMKQDGQYKAGGLSVSNGDKPVDLARMNPADLATRITEKLQST